MWITLLLVGALLIVFGVVGAVRGFVLPSDEFASFGLRLAVIAWGVALTGAGYLLVRWGRSLRVTGRGRSTGTWLESAEPLPPPPPTEDQTPPQPSSDESNTAAVAAFVLGIASVLTFPLVVVSIPAIILGVRGWRNAFYGAPHPNLAFWGLGLGILGLALGIAGWSSGF